MEERTAVINLRIEPTLKTAFEKMAARNDRTTSQMIRDYIRYAVAQESAQGALELTQEAPSKPKKGQRLAEASKQALRGGR